MLCCNARSCARKALELEQRKDGLLPRRTFPVPLFLAAALLAALLRRVALRLMCPVGFRFFVFGVWPEYGPSGIQTLSSST